MSLETKDKLLDAALKHVAFDGWGDTTLNAAANDIGVTPTVAKSLFPGGAIAMAVAYHQRGDAAMIARMLGGELDGLRYSEKVAAAVRFRLQAVSEKEIVRRGMTLFSLPQHAGDGAQLVWGTADQIWTTLGDTSDDANWYSKRAILSAVYGTSVLFWLGDTSDDNARTWAFVDRRIGDVMRFEKFKARVRDNKTLAPFLTIPNALLGQIRAPSRTRRTDLPGHWPPTQKPASQDNT